MFLCAKEGRKEPTAKIVETLEVVKIPLGPFGFARGHESLIILKIDRRIFFALIPFLLFSLLLVTPTLGAAKPDIITAIDAPGEAPTGLAWDGQYLWNADKYDKIYKLNPSNGQVIDSFDSPANDPTGLAWDGQYLWNADWETDKIYKLNPSDGQVVSSFDSPSSVPAGLTWDGQYLWNADQLINRIFKVDPSDGQVVDSFETPSPDGRPTGLAWDGQFLWIVNRGRNINKVSPSDGHLASAFEIPGEHSWGLAWDGQYLWTSDDRTGQETIYKLDVAGKIGFPCLGTILVAIIPICILFKKLFLYPWKKKT